MKKSILAVLAGLVIFWFLIIMLAPIPYGGIFATFLAGIVVGYISGRKGLLLGAISGFLSGITLPTTFFAIAIPILGIIAPQIVSNSQDISIGQMNKLYLDIFLVFIFVVIFESIGGFVGELLYKRKNENSN